MSSLRQIKFVSASQIREQIREWFDQRYGQAWSPHLQQPDQYKIATGPAQTSDPMAQVPTRAPGTPPAEPPVQPNQRPRGMSIHETAGRGLDAMKDRDYNTAEEALKRIHRVSKELGV